jgi:DNA-binding MarR family transcriptional regulator
MTRSEAIGPPLIGALVRRPAEALQQRIIEEAIAAGFTDLVPAHLAVLRYPGPNGRRPSDLAAEAGTTRQAMNYLLGQLEALGYVIRVEDPDDLRSKQVHLTERGEQLREAIRDSVARIETELEHELGTNTYRRLRGLLVRLNESSLVRSHYSAESFVAPQPQPITVSR